jgi:Arc/MetJ-type ribon-helix-helix transcriptional regulator
VDAQAYAGALPGSRSELIRRAIRDRYGERDWEIRRVGLRQSAGAWADREQTGAATVDASRGDLNDRLARLGWS